jgi:hypothetical protein
MRNRMPVFAAGFVIDSEELAMRLIMTIAFVASAALGQANRVLQLTQNESREQMEQIATVLRAVAGLQVVSMDDEQRTLTVEGAPSQLAMGGWLIGQMGRAAAPAVHEYREPAGGDDVVRVFYAGHAPTPRDLQEIAVIVRSVADIRRVFVYSAASAVTVRGTNQQILLAAWLMEQLDQPADAAAPSPHEYKLSGDDVARVFDLANQRNPLQLQELATLIRSIADMQRLFVCSRRRSVVLRGPAERVALSAWLVAELDKPLAGDRSARHEYRLATGPDNLVRLFYLPGEPDRLKVATQVRTTARIPRLFLDSAHGALAVRGTAGQVATAERLLEEMKVF